MAKIEEITALLINEIESFEKAVSTLQIETEKIKNTKFKVDTTAINARVLTFTEEIFKHFHTQNNELIKLQNNLNKTISIPKWAIILFSSFFIVFLLSFSINFYQYQKTKTIKNEAYNQGMIEVKNYMHTFFQENPSTYKTFQKWENKK